VNDCVRPCRGGGGGVGGGGGGDGVGSGVGGGVGSGVGGGVGGVAHGCVPVHCQAVVQRRVVPVARATHISHATSSNVFLPSLF